MVETVVSPSSRANDRYITGVGSTDAQRPIATAPYRLRDLKARERWVAGVLVLVMMAPFVLSVGRAIRADWYPLGDDALISLRAQEASRGDFPLVGQPSTSHLYGAKVIAHPGPIEFYWLAVPQRVLGPALGTILAMSALYFSAVLVTAWMVFGVQARCQVQSVRWHSPGCCRFRGVPC